MRPLVVLACLVLAAARAHAAPPSPSTAPRADPLAALEHQIDERTREAASEASRNPCGHFPDDPRPHSHDQPSPAPTVFHDYPLPHTHAEPEAPGRPSSILEPFHHDFIRRALVSGLLAGGICAWLGLFIVLRRMVFVGVALAQVASAGVALAVYMGWDPITVALISTLGMSCGVGLSRSRRGNSPEVRIGLLYACAGSLAVILLAKSASGEGEQLEMLQGTLLAVSPVSAMELTVMAAFVIGLHILGFNRLVAVSFDPLSAQVAGVHVWFWNMVLLLTLGAGISVSIQWCGLLLVFGYLVLPPASGLATRLRLPGVLATAQICQATSTVLGLWLAYVLDWPPGPAIVVMMMAFMLIVPPIVRVARRATLRDGTPAQR